MLLLSRILFCSLMLCGLSVAAERYYHTNVTSAPLPDAHIAALEARCKLSAANAARGQLACWSLSWGADSATIEFDSRYAFDGIGSPSLRISCAGQSAEVKADDHFDGWNSMAVEWSSDGQGATILFGGNEMHPILTIDRLERPCGTVSVSASHPRGLAVQEIIVETASSPFERLKVDADVSQLPLWYYLDMSTDSERTTTARRGGRYVLSLLPQPYGYDIIYRDGAEVLPDSWTAPMLKGKLITHGFAGHYELRWVDALGRNLPGEHYAELNSAERLLTLVFPSLGSKLRFAQ